MVKSFKYTPLTDMPSVEDKFASGGHSRCAEALVNSIKLSRDCNRSIGLEGNWGSGKSSVVAMAEDKLLKENYQFFTYDLWTSKNASFRRGFLEALNDWLSTKKQPISQSIYEEFKERITSRQKDITTTTYRKFSLFGGFFVVSLAIMPFLALWLSPFGANVQRTFRQAPKDGEIPIDLPWIYDVLIKYGHWVPVVIITLLVVLFFREVLCVHWRSKDEIDSSKIIGFWEAIQRSLSLFSHKSKADTQTQSIRDKDPTQNEFQNIFMDMLKASQKNEKRIIFVLDNIDRLPKDAIADVWSEVRSVANPQTLSKTDKNQTITTIIPYDRMHILRALRPKETPSLDNESISAVNKISPTYANEDVFRKTFDAVLTVSPPLASNLQQYLEQGFNEVLNNSLDGGQLYRLFQIYDAFITENQILPTPRQVLSYVNDVGSYVAQWQDAISPEAIAIYVLHKVALQADPKLARNLDNFPKGVVRSAAQPDLSEQLLAICYNVPKKSVFELTMDRDILRAIAKSEPEDFIEISKTSGFTTRIHHLLHEHLPEIAKDPSDFCNAMENWLGAELDDVTFDNARSAFESGFISLGKASLADYELVKRLPKILKIAEPDSVPTLISNFADWIETHYTNNEDDRSFSHGREWIKALGTMLNNVSSRSDFTNIKSQIAIPEGAGFLLGVALDVDEFSLHIRDFKQKKYLPQDFNSLLIELIEDRGSYFEFIWREISTRYKSEEDIQSLFDAVCAQLEEQELTTDALRNTTQNLMLLWTSGRNFAGVSARIERLLKNGGLWKHFEKARDEEIFEVLAAGMLVVADWLEKTTDIPNLEGQQPHPKFGDLSNARAWTQSVINGDSNFDAIDKLADYVLEQNMVERWLDNGISIPQNSLSNKTVRAIFCQESYHHNNINQIVKNFDHIKTLMGDQIEAFLSRIQQEDIETQVNDIDIKEISGDTLRQLSERDGEIWKAITAKAVQYLKDIGQDSWTSAFNGDDQQLWEQLWNLADKVGTLKLENIRAPLKARVEHILTDESSNSEELNDESRLFNLLQIQSQKTLYRDVLNGLSQLSVAENGPTNLDIVCPNFFKLTEFSANPSNALDSLFAKSATGGMQVVLDLIQKNPKEWKKVGNNASIEDINLIHETVQFPEHEDNDDAKTVSEIYKILSLEPLNSLEKEQDD